MAEADRGKGSQALATRSPTTLRRPRNGRDLEVEGLWFTLARSEWRTLVLVPADEHGSSVEVAAALADVGRRLRTGPVTFLLLSGSMDYAAAGKIVQAMGGRRGVHAHPESQGDGRLLIAIPPVVTEPLGLAVTEVVDGVVLCIQRGQSRMSVARRTVEMVGRGRILGAIMV